MKHIFPKFLIIMLAMLQFVAPLVHAHSGGQNFSQGLHIPGLETYLDNDMNSAGQFAAINPADWEQEGFLVVVDAGIKKSNDAVVINHFDDFTLLPVETLIKPCLLVDGYQSTKHNQWLPSRKPIFSLPPRAPPATISYA